jgi:hypothetical protein
MAGQHRVTIEEKWFYCAQLKDQIDEFERQRAVALGDLEEARKKVGFCCERIAANTSQILKTLGK